MTLAASGNQRLRNTAQVRWDQRMGNDNDRRLIFVDRPSDDELERLLNSSRLRWLGRVLRMPVNWLPRRVLFADTASG